MSEEVRNVLVTGGCGFIGSNFINYIFKAWPNATFVNVDKLILNSDTMHVDEEIRNSTRYKLELSDIKNEKKILNILEENNIDTIFHFAADCTSTRCYNDPVEAVENNVVSFVTFLETLRQYNRLRKMVHISTDEVYGDSGLGEDEKGKSEQSLLLPGNPYAATKIGGEAFVDAYRQAYGLPIVTARVNNIYGPNQWDVKVVPRFIQIAKERGSFTIQGTGKQLRSWLFVDDAARGLQAIAERGIVGEIYNLGTYFEMNVRDLATTVQKEVDEQLGRNYQAPNFISIPDRPYNDLRLTASFGDEIIHKALYKSALRLNHKLRNKSFSGLRKTVASVLLVKKSVKMFVVLFGGRGFIGTEIQKKLDEHAIPFSLANTKPGIDEDETASSTALLCIDFSLL